MAAGLLRLATSSSVLAIQFQIAETLETYQAALPLSQENRRRQESMLVSFDLAAETEELRCTPPPELWAMIGLGTTQRIVGIERYRDTLTGRESSSWTTNSVDWWKKIPSSEITEQSPRHHQIVGLVKILGWLMGKKGGLIADAVGVGKTLQVILGVVERMNILERYNVTQVYPESLSELLS